ncbi:MAG: Holliday junction resolvase-like protein [Nanoarchaeota archaeon]|nr:Holliday junction resolvase-like protein [Nanoarchaeota archaeon]
MITLILLTTSIILLLILLYYYYHYQTTRQQLENYQFNNKSLVVKHGKNWEQFTPFMKDFPGNKENFRFLGTPIDGIIFDDEEIKFIEIKTGTSRLSDKQERIKNLIEKKKVSWKELRY